MNDPEMPGRIVAHIAKAPAMNKNQEASGVSAGVAEVI